MYLGEESSLTNKNAYNESYVGLRGREPVIGWSRKKRAVGYLNKKVMELGARERKKIIGIV